MKRTRPPVPTIPLFEVSDAQTPADEMEADTTEWWERAVAGVHQLAKTGLSFQAYDLVQRAGVPEPSRPGAQWGALFAALAREGVIVPVGYGPSPRPTTRSSAARIWRGAVR